MRARYLLEDGTVFELDVEKTGPVPDIDPGEIVDPGGQKPM